MRPGEIKEGLRQTGVGLLMGLLCLIFGIAWAAYMGASHDRLHRQLDLSARAALEDRFVLSGADEHEGHGGRRMEHAHGKGPGHEGGMAASGAYDGGHVQAAYVRLAMGHVHAMGLGVLTIAVSLALAFVPAPGRGRTLAAACLGTGSFFYPLSWIVMGFRTAALGGEAARESVLPMASLSILLVAAGLLLALFFVARWLMARR